MLLYTVVGYIISCINMYTVLIFLAGFLLSTHGLKHRSQNLPPGPWSLPFIGNFLGLVYKLFRTGDEPEYQLAAMAKRYGDVFTLRVGSKIMIIANRYKSIKEAYENPLISDRPKSKGFEATVDEGREFMNAILLVGRWSYMYSHKIYYHMHPSAYPQFHVSFVHY